jgi:non-ribosomal peptide synthetase-like protein
MNQTEQALERFALIGDEDAYSTRADFTFSDPEEVLTCPGYPPEIRWQPGERLDHLFEKRFSLLRETGAGNRVAVTAEDGELSYDDLERQANRLSRHLIASGVRPGDRIGLLFSRSVWAYAAMLGVMKANAAYVPLDPGFPKDRIAFIAEDAGIRLVLTTASLRGHLDTLAAEVICLDEVQPAIDREECTALDPPAESLADDLCYIIYTSGSTGKPKGVAVEHRSICNFVRVAAEVYGIMPEDRVYQGMTIAFDFSVEEIWVPLYSGATLVAAPPGPSLVGRDLSQFLEARRITALCCVPTLLATLDDDLPSLRFILVSGEACPQNLVERWYSQGRTFLNVYGPTEATVTATWTMLVPDKPVTIGVPLPTYKILILAPDEPRLVEKGGIGEICIAGIGLARGYVNRPDLTDKAFIPDFLGLDDNPSGRIYRTGDLGRITDKGEIEYLGRLDAQVKIRGYRIELAEIESVIMRVPGIAQAVVGTFQPEPGTVELVAYYTLRHDVDHLDRETIVGTIRGDLPAYMLPAFFERMDALPMLPCDKVDRKRLPPPSGPRHSVRKADCIAPANDTEAEIARTLMDLLKLEQVSMDDHFFDDLGANSLLMARFCARIREKLNYSDVSMREVYLHPTPRDFAAFLTTQAHRKAPTAPAEPVHVARDLDYWLCGGMQLIFYFVYSTALTAGLVQGYVWISEAHSVADTYLRSAAFGSGMFLAMAALPIAVKWLVVGRSREESIPIWSSGYFRFWLIRRMIQANPMVMFVGTPLYNVYLRLLGAKIGRNVVIFSGVVPACPDLLSIGDGTIIKKDSNLVGYRARAGLIETGRITIGRDAFIGEATVLDIGTSIGDGAQLGHSSSLHQGQAIPDGKRYHGSPARETSDDYLSVEPMPCGIVRRAAFSAAQAVVLFGLTLPLPLVILDSLLVWLGFGTGAEVAAHVGARFNDLDFQLTLIQISAGAYFGLIVLGLLSIVTIPRLLNLFMTEGKTYPLYGFHFLVHRAISSRSNSYFFNLLFGDSSYIIYYLRAIGYKISLKDQTGSNFGVAQKHDTPFLCEIGKGTLISDGFSMINADFSSSSFRLRRVSVGADSFIGNNVFYPAGSRVGDNCLFGTKTMVPVGGPELKDVGLLGSPSFQIPRSVARDRQLEHYRDGPTFKDRLFRKNISNTVTIFLYLASQWFFVHLVILLSAVEMDQYAESGWIALLDFTMIVLVLTVAYYALLEHASIGFRKLRPQFCSIYDDYYWKHERFWKLSEVFYLDLFSGTPFKGMVWRLLGVKVGRKLFDDGSGIPEKTLVTIGDNCTINRMVTIQGHSLEDGAFKSDYIRIGDGCTIGYNAFVHYGVEMEDNVALGPDSFLMKGEHLAANSTWRGNPAREI